MKQGLIHLDLPARLMNSRTKLSYFWAGKRISPEITNFIASNYLPFDPGALDLGVVGKELTPTPVESTFEFNVYIAANYCVVSESGSTAGSVDGQPCMGPRFLAAGAHEFVRSAGRGHAAIILADAVRNGFHPLFAVSERLIAQASKDHK